MKREVCLSQLQVTILGWSWLVDFTNYKTCKKIQIPMQDPIEEKLVSRNWNCNLDDSW